MEDEIGKLIEPEPVPFSFTAPGWYVVGGLLLVFIMICIYLLIKHYKSNLYRKHAQLFLTETEKKLSSEEAFGQMVYETQMLIKRIAMGRYGREVSGLREDQWIAFINSTWHEGSFDDKDNELISQSIYKSSPPVTNDQAQVFVKKAGRWLRRHKRHLK